MRLTPLVLAAAFFAPSVYAHADFTYTIDDYGEIITFNEPTLATTPFNVSQFDISGSNYGTTEVQVSPTTSQVGDCKTNIVSVQACLGFINNVGEGYAYFDQPLDAVGFYTDDDSAITVDIANGPASVSPEPSTLLLLGTGVFGVAGAIRRRLV